MLIFRAKRFSNLNPVRLSHHGQENSLHGQHSRHGQFFPSRPRIFPSRPIIPTWSVRLSQFSTFIMQSGSNFTAIQLSYYPIRSPLPSTQISSGFAEPFPPSDADFATAYLDLATSDPDHAADADLASSDPDHAS